MENKDLFGLVHIKTSFEDWEALFLGHVDNRTQVEAGNFVYAKAGDKLAMVMLKGVNLQDMMARMQDPEFAKLVEKDIESHEMYLLEAMVPPEGK